MTPIESIEKYVVFEEVPFSMAAAARHGSSGIASMVCTDGKNSTRDSFVANT